MSEANLSKKILTACQARGAFGFKTLGDPRVTRGLPDLIVCYRGHFIGFEVKLPGREKNVTALQSARLQAIADAGGIACVISSVAEAQNILTSLDGLTHP